jgi:hypothetical protein
MMRARATLPQANSSPSLVSHSARLRQPRVECRGGAAGGPLYEIAGVWIKRPDEMGSGNALRNADSPLERLGSWHRVRTGSNP